MRYSQNSTTFRNSNLWSLSSSAINYNGCVHLYQLPYSRKQKITRGMLTALRNLNFESCHYVGTDVLQSEEQIFSGKSSHSVYLETTDAVFKIFRLLPIQKDTAGLMKGTSFVRSNLQFTSASSSYYDACIRPVGLALVRVSRNDLRRWMDTIFSFNI